MTSGFEPQSDVTMFHDRRDAGRRLAAALARYAGAWPLVLGLPRGGVVVAAEVAAALEGELDILMSRKIGAPVSAELALGAVTADGVRILNDDVVREFGVPEDYIARATAAEQANARTRELELRGERPAPVVAGRVVILVDDGLATGATMRAAVAAVRRRGPARLVVAVPVGSPSACAALRSVADEVVCLETPEWFAAVGQFYADFAQVSDAEVRRLLRPAAPA